MRIERLALGLSFVTGLAMAASQSYVIGSSRCKILHFENNAWKPASDPSLTKGVEVSGGPQRGWPNHILVRRNGQLFSFPARCLQASGAGGAISAVPGGDDSAPMANDSGSSSGSDDKGWAAFIYYEQWKESIQLEVGRETSSDLSASNHVVQLGAEWHKTNALGELDVSGGLLLGSSSLVNATGADTPVTVYSASGSKIFGLAFEGGYGFHLGRSFEVGPRVALIFRSASWPSPAGTTYTLSQTAGLFAAFAVQAKYNYRQFYMALSLGLYESMSNFMLTVGPGYRF